MSGFYNPQYNWTWNDSVDWLNVYIFQNNTRYLLKKKIKTTIKKLQFQKLYFRHPYINW